MNTTVHVDNVTSRTAFVKGGYTEVITYQDAQRDRNTTVLKFASAEANSVSLRRGNSQNMRVIGIQSGNAVDGIDVGIFDFEPLNRHPDDPRKLAGSLNYTTIANKTYPFTPEERNWVLGLRAMALENGNEYAEGNYKFGEWLADRALRLIDETGIDKSSIQLIGSHGQTISGHPHWEFGDVSVIAQKTGITTAADFRPADVAAGGNGTPCTCTYDSIMLRPPVGSKKWRIGINIGGTSSVTFCPPWPTKGNAEEEAMIPGGLDPGLGVFFMDLTVREIDPTLEFDDNGNMARSGKVNEELLAEFLENKYYKQDKLPIGVGPDDFPETLWKVWHARAQELGVSNVDLLTTFTELTAKQIAMACKRWGGPNIVNGATDDVLLRGGVTNNGYFVERLLANMSEQLNTTVPKITSLEDIGVDEDSWENAMYAMFGYLCYNNVYNFVPSCTGAERPVVGGRIAPGENFHSVRLTDTPC
jgi:anhydro-N-acetylmuramic acid kinase